MKILVVDDEPQYRMLVGHFLQDQGWDVDTAENGEDGLAKLSSAKFDIVISDIYMPIMDGLKFHKSVRSNPAFETLPFLFVSAYDDEYTLAAVKSPKYEGFLRKGRPVTELKSWVVYLTTPPDRRPHSPPGKQAF
jgi:two-component system chemotaxis response regulator CheY